MNVKYNLKMFYFSGMKNLIKPFFYYDAQIIHYLDHIIIHLIKNKEDLERGGSRNKRIMIVIIHY